MCSLWEKVLNALSLSCFEKKKLLVAPFSEQFGRHFCLLSTFLFVQAFPVFAAELDENSTSASEVTPTNSPAVLANFTDKALGKDAFPPEFFALLQAGVEVPFLLKTPQGAEEVGKATLRHTGDFLTIDHLSVGNSKVTAEYQALIEQQYGKPIHYQQCSRTALDGAATDKQNKNHLHSDTSDKNAGSDPAAAIGLCFDVMTFELIGDLPQEAYSQEARLRITALPDSTEKNLSGILNYNGSMVRLSGQNPDGYFRAKSVTSYGVNNFTLDGDVRANQPGDLYEARFSHDYQGVNVSAGYLSLWAMSDLGRISYANSGKFIGVIAGNKGRSEKTDTSLSKNPIYVFMPASGQVSIYRDGKLLNVQQVALGNQEVDTSALPGGNYLARVDVIVNGQVVSSKEEMVYKMSSSIGAGNQYQFFAGNYQNTYDGTSTHLVGASGQYNLPWVDLSASVYSYGSLMVIEPGFQKNFSHGSISGQFGVTSDGSHNGTLSSSLSLGSGSVWGMLDYARKGKPESAMTDRNFASLGGTFDLQNTFNLSKSSQITGSVSLDRQNNNRISRLDFSQSIYRNHWVEARLNAGKYWQTHQQDFDNNYTEIGLGNSMPSSAGNLQQSYYVGVNFTFSFGTGGIDYSRSLNSEMIGVNAAWTPKNIDGLDHLGTNVSRTRSLDDPNADISSNINVRANGRNSIFAWDAVVGSNSLNKGVDVTGGMSGSAGWNKGGFGMTNSQADAGILVKVDDEARGQLDLMVNGGSNLLENSTSFVPAPAFSTASMAVRSSAKSPENYDIQNSEQDFVLYPGNVGLLSPKLKRLVTVFGVLTENGQPKPGVVLSNHIGTATTDEDGGFSVDVDSVNPSVSYEVAKNQSCQIDFDLSAAKGAMWVNEVFCPSMKPNGKQLYEAAKPDMQTAIPAAESVVGSVFSD